MRRLGALCAVSILALAGPAAAQQPPGTAPGVLRERIALAIPSGGRSVTLDAMVTRLNQPGRQPLLIWTHGAPRVSEDRAKVSPAAAAEAMISFAQRGWTVVSVVRRGFGRSQGDYAEGVDCARPNYAASAKASGNDLLEALRVLAKRDDVDASRVVLAGVSAGGFAALGAAAERPQGLAAVLSFAGGRGAEAPDSVCAEDKLVEAFGALGARIKVPTFWAYAANDHYFRPELAQRALAAFTQAGGKASFAALPAFGEDGHFLTSREGIALWRDPLDRFLRIQRLPTWEAPLKPPTAFLPPPPDATPAMLADFQRYMESFGFEKAFVVNGRGGFAWRTGRSAPEEAVEDALAACSARNTGCRVYAINNALAR